MIAMQDNTCFVDMSLFTTCRILRHTAAAAKAGNASRIRTELQLAQHHRFSRALKTDNRAAPPGRWGASAARLHRWSGIKAPPALKSAFARMRQLFCNFANPAPKTALIFMPTL